MYNFYLFFMCSASNKAIMGSRVPCSVRHCVKSTNMPKEFFVDLLGTYIKIKYLSRPNLILILLV
jgi:hypothetical protein